MPTPASLFQAVLHRVRQATRAEPVTLHAQRRLALLVTGILAAQSCVLALVAAKVQALRLTCATDVASVERRLRRTLNDPHLTPERCYAPALPALLADAVARTPAGPLAPPRAVRRAAGPAGGPWLTLVADDSTNQDRIHLFRVSLGGWGAGLPLAWAAWAQNVRQAAGHYWRMVDTVFAQVAAVLPAGVTVVLLGDAFFDIPAFIDRATARDWHWVVRGSATGDLCFRDHLGREHRVRELVARHVRAPGQRWKARGAVFKGAGWRPASLVVVWAPGHEEPLVVLTDLPCRWEVLAHYDRRFWIEPTFRNDKTRGWQWETSQVRGVAHHQVLLLALAWATLCTLTLGYATAQEQGATLVARVRRALARGRRPAKPQPARWSLFTLGLRALDTWLLRPLTPPSVEPAARAGVAAGCAGDTGPPKGPLPWRLPPLDHRSWCQQYYEFQAHLFLFPTTVRS